MGTRFNCPFTLLEQEFSESWELFLKLYSQGWLKSSHNHVLGLME